MAKKQSYTWPIITCVVALFLILVALPESSKQWSPSFIRNAGLHFGLDLAGGTQLDFRISEEEIRQQIADLTAQIAELEASHASSDAIAQVQLQRSNIEAQQRNIMEAIRTVLERRINALGVSESTITPSYIGNEKHLLVECPGVVDTQVCIDTVGKTIKLEFKEEFTEPTKEFESSVREKADATLRRFTQSGDTLQVVAEDISDDLGVAYIDNGRYFQDALPEGLEDLWNKPAGETVYRREGVLIIQQTDAEGNPAQQEVPGIFLSQVSRARTQTGRVINEAGIAFDLLEKQEEGVSHLSYEKEDLTTVDPLVAGILRGMRPGELHTVTLADDSARILFLQGFVPGREEMEASHILIAYEGATSASLDVTRTKEEALELATEIKGKLTAGESFESLAATYSDGPSGKDGGSLGTFGRDTMVPAFAEASFALAKGQISDPVETAFGFHIIRADSTPVNNADQATFEELQVTGESATTRAEALLKRLQDGDVRSMEDMVFLRSIFLSLIPTGWKDTPLDGKHFQTATVTLDPVTNIPVVQITFDDEGAKLFQELTANNIDKRIAIFVGGQLVSAPTVQTEISGGIAIITGMRSFDDAKSLAQDLNTGAIPAPIYLSGQRTVEATLGAEALQTSLRAAVIGIIILMVYMILVYRLLGLMADIALSVYALIFFAMLKLPLLLFSSQYIVLSLAGMAGIILSIGMAVDANVLIFERMKEELRKGKLLTTAAEIGFKRAWPSIRDGNVSTFITCAILFTIGTSIVRGFAVTLGLGVLLSMFTAIVITRFLVRKLALTPLGERPELFGVRKKQE
ncbi:protein translocase subunit SecD [Candidatus Peregrinibacteria bacterium CG10_big_fil_rev_8_21_14_0_10_49_24]|nr:MAG: protein translocase subunit SecD [Candidatus Peregrinibacteria bacterium CG11_big_fil_rev_8_21_14_0_20_49_14]PIR51642.1 MAG: protein translocase subunit SecD [Candidatus Peregrinibacteria bacterium CG10_big_fil_rev_8_21_14_0_10_49_24]PJA67998.1 MAG: protein translocase subunit SecD [Candidatus Peregrinibacteria bacterium CG_4_9_14_3_um_filter_49_12]